MNTSKKNGTTKLRFAALCRVSTEKQEKEGESLRTQKTNIEKFVVEDLGGSIVKWYGGQEHATPGYEKEEVGKLIADAHKKRFDAVIVNDHSRWSRDNTYSERGLEVFREHGIRFFTGLTEWDLFNPSHVMFLSMNAVIGKFFAHDQQRKSLDNRIKRAERGIPTGGKLPFGRMWIWDDEDTRQSGTWKIDKEKRRIIQDCAKRYLAGETLEALAKEYGVTKQCNLHKVLTKVSGTQWQIEFKSKALNIHEVVEMEIPRLLDDGTIKAIRKKAKLNRVYNGIRVHDYLFSGMMWCAHCGSVLQGQANKQKRRYYRNQCFRRQAPCPGPAHKAWILADVIEDAVMRHLFEAFGNPAAVRAAIEAATPNDEGVREAIKRQAFITKQLDKLEASRQRILDLVADDTISDASAKTKLDKLNEREQRLKEEHSRLDDELRHIPSAERIKNVSKIIAGQFRQHTNARAWAKKMKANAAFEEMTWQEKRQLCEMVFSGELVDGRPMGIWITWSKDGKKWKYRIEGHLIDESGPFKKGGFEFGAAPLQKDLVAESARQSPCNARCPAKNANASASSTPPSTAGAAPISSRNTAKPSPERAPIFHPR